jgi:hypothetical protein
MVFVARGAGPFVLARATPADRSAAMPLSDLMPGRAADAAWPAPSTELVALSASPTASASNPIAAKAPSRTPRLWAALLAGLALMGRMAWSLLRKTPAPAPRGVGAGP